MVNLQENILTGPSWIWNRASVSCSRTVLFHDQKHDTSTLNQLITKLLWKIKKELHWISF